MSNRINKMKRRFSKLDSTAIKGVVMIHGAMWYQCGNCNRKWRMWLEKGLEDRINTGKHKPVPFTIRCSCGEFAHHVDWNNDIRFDTYRSLGDSMSYFKNSYDSDCGVSVLKFDKPIIQTDSEKEVSDGEN